MKEDTTSNAVEAEASYRRRSCKRGAQMTMRARRSLTVLSVLSALQKGMRLPRRGVITWNENRAGLARLRGALL